MQRFQFEKIKINKAISLLLILISISIFYFFFIFTVDDAYIVLRYARNLAEKNELTFNSGEYVNALTSPLHVLICSFIYTIIGEDTLVVSKLFMALVTGFSALLFVKSFPNPIVKFYLLISILLSPFVVMWACGGLETLLLFFLISLILFLLKKYKMRSHFAISIICGLAFLVRFDSFLFSSAVMIYILMQDWKTKRQYGRILLLLFLSFILPLVWLSFSYSYFGDFFPSSFHTKAKTIFRRGNVYYFFQGLLLSGILLFYFWGLLGNTKQRIQAHFYSNWYLYASIIFIFFYSAFNAQVHMMFGYRLFLPFLPIFFYLTSELLDKVVKENKKTLFHAIRVSLVAFVLLQCLQAYHIYHYSLNGYSLVGEYRKIGIHDYQYNFIKIMEKQSKDLKIHIKKNNKFLKRNPSMFTFAEGFIPYQLNDLHIYGSLVSYGLYTRSKLKKSADYLHIVSPLHGEIKSQLESLMDQVQLISEYQVLFDGEYELFQVYYNPNPID